MKRILCFVLSLSFAFCSMFVLPNDYVGYASSEQDEINKLNNQIKNAEKQLEKLKSEKKDKEKDQHSLEKEIQIRQDRVTILEKKSNALKRNINDIQNSISKTESQITSIQAQIDAKQKDFEKTYDLYSQRLRAMYVSGHVSNLEVLLSSADISSILIRSQMINSISKQDSEMLDKLTEQMEIIEKDKVELEKKRNELNSNKQSLENSKKELDSDLNEIKQEKADLDKKIAQCNADIKAINSSESEYIESIDEYRAKIKEINDALKGSSTGDGQISDGGGKLGYPTSYRKISAGFPKYPSGREHTGVDFPCPVGTPVHASADGVVHTVKRLNSSYGYYIIIDHGDGLTTLYAHNSQLLVSAGQRVERGQVIAMSGNTGNSTGPHCHFEVRINKTPVNPMNYLG